MPPKRWAPATARTLRAGEDIWPTCCQSLGGSRRSGIIVLAGDLMVMANELSLPQDQVSALGVWLDGALKLDPSTPVHIDERDLPQVQGYEWQPEDMPMLASFLQHARQTGLTRQDVQQLCQVVVDANVRREAVDLRGRNIHEYFDRGLSRKVQEIQERKPTLSRNKPAGPSKEEVALTRLMKSDFDRYLRSGGRDRLMALREARGAGASAYDDSDG
jgi:hypothetical protein